MSFWTQKLTSRFSKKANLPAPPLAERPVEKNWKRASDEDWKQVLIRSVDEPIIDGVSFPRFPPPDLQARFVGSANSSALGEALTFYSLFKNKSEELDEPINAESTFLDFGCGWGRFLRFFWREFDEKRLAGVDVDPDMIELCKASGIEAQLHQIDNIGNLPFGDNSFSHIMAYSVFTHLPEHVHLHWIRELHRVAKNGCILICTTQPRRFIEFIASITDPQTSWHASLKKTAGNAEALLQQFDRGEFVYLASGGGVYRDKSVYGDTIIPVEWLREKWHTYFEIEEYIDDRQKAGQAIVIAKKKAI